MNGFIKFALELANMPSVQIADLEAKLPGITRICAAAKKLEPDLQLLEPIVERMLPTVKAVWPDIVAATPTVEGLIEFVAGKSHSA